MSRLYLGIDTSYYTTSVALVDGAGRLLEDRRRPLTVPEGERGARPSDGVWEHLNALPELADGLLRQHRTDIAAVAASVRPRPQPDSYLPSFRVGEGYARAVAAAIGVPFIGTSHQEMHLMAGLWSAEAPPKGTEFLAVHLSGGTTELLRVRRRPGGFYAELLGGTQDLHCGQLVDRVGVALGLPFPSGPHLERLAEEAESPAALPSFMRGRTVGFSGTEAAALRLVGEAPAPSLALGLFHAVARTLEKWLRPAMAETGLSEVLLVGGVAANSILRRRLPERVRGSFSFARPQFSVDNAVGVALIAKESAEVGGNHY
jgi:N6-L-threonylcarbamoyladenine synthase